MAGYYHWCMEAMFSAFVQEKKNTSAVSLGGAKSEKAKLGRTTVERTIWGQPFCPLLRGCSLLGG